MSGSGGGRSCAAWRGEALAAKPRVAVFCPERFLPYSQTFIYDELRSHARYEADVFALGKSNEGSFPFARVHTPRSLFELSAYLGASRSKAFDDVFRVRKPRLVHAHFGTSAVFAQPYARRYGLPLVVTFHGYDVAILTGRARALPHRWRYWAMSRAILRDAAVLLCASGELCELVRRLGGRPDRVRLYQLGVDVQRYYRAAELRQTLRVTMIGRFVEKKGHIYGIEAFARCRQAKLPVHLSIVGSGPLEAKYREVVARHDIGAAVTFHGVLGTEQVAELLARTDILLAPSCVAADGDRESGLLVVREAGAAGVPVISTCHGGIPESIEHGHTGYLVPERNVCVLADRLLELITQPFLRERLGKAARAKMFRQFRLADRVAELEAIYDEVSGGLASGAPADARCGSSRRYM